MTTRTLYFILFDAKKFCFSKYISGWRPSSEHNDYFAFDVLTKFKTFTFCGEGDCGKGYHYTVVA